MRFAKIPSGSKGRDSFSPHREQNPSTQPEISSRSTKVLFCGKLRAHAAQMYIVRIDEKWFWLGNPIVTMMKPAESILRGLLVLKVFNEVHGRPVRARTADLYRVKVG